MLARRPDVAAAQRKLLAAQTRVGVAQAAWFPDLTLTSAGGYASSQLRDIFRWSARAWSVEGCCRCHCWMVAAVRRCWVRPVPTWNVALADYRQHLAVAGRGGGFAQRHPPAGAAGRGPAAGRCQRQPASAMADSRYRNGQTGQLELLDAQRSELTIRRRLEHPAGPLPGLAQPDPGAGGSWNDCKSSTIGKETS
jgi:multidrug efflux system outer membrane protein